MPEIEPPPPPIPGVDGPHPEEVRMKEIDGEVAPSAPAAPLVYDPALHDQFIKEAVRAAALNDQLRRVLYGARVGLQVVWVSNTQVQVTADYLSVEGHGFESLDLTVTMPTDLDTGSETTSTRYHLWLVCDSRGEQEKLRISLSATAPTMPGGLAAKRRICGLYNNAAGHIAPFINWKDDDWFWYNLDQNIAPYNLTVPSPAPTSPTDVVASSFVPSTSREIAVEADLVGLGSGLRLLYMRNKDTPLLVTPKWMGGGGLQSTSRRGTIGVDSVQTFQVWTPNTGRDLSLLVQGHKESYR